MRNLVHTYKNKVVSVEEALQQVKSDMDIVLQVIPEPQGFLGDLHTQADRVTNVRLYSVLTVGPYECFLNPKMQGHFELISYFYGPTARAGAKVGLVDYWPNFLHDIAALHPKTRKVDIFVGSCTPPDKQGFVSLSLSTAYEKDLLECADTVILEVSEKLPRTFGDTEVRIDDVDFFIETHCDAPTIPSVQPTEKDFTIGNYIAELIEDESTIQLGIGGIPNAVGKCLTKKKNLGVHTEMLNDAMMDLYEMGVITNKKKSFHKYQFICAFCLGSKELYDWVDGNVGIRFRRGKWVNDPSVVRKNSKMVSINTCMMVDFFGQVFSEGTGFNNFSGTGGQFDTAYGAREGLDGLGKSVIACYSTAKGGKISTIVPHAPHGTPVTLPRNVTDYVVTEYGVAWLRGKTEKERVRALIDIAHPDFREQLKEEAGRLGFLK